jgi:hypothetical protein
MRFIETSVFTRAVTELLGDDQYHSLQLALMLRPELAPIVRGGGGIRKLRWAIGAKGKRGGIRVIYFWDKRSECFYMLYVYRKTDQEDLTTHQLRSLARLVREEFG